MLSLLERGTQGFDQTSEAHKICIIGTSMSHRLRVQSVSSVGQPCLTQSNNNENSLSFFCRSLIVSSSNMTESFQMLTAVARPSWKRRDCVAILHQQAAAEEDHLQIACFMIQTIRPHQTILPVSSACMLN